MKLNQHLKQWKQVVSSRFPHLSLPQVSGLATWSFGMVMARSSSLRQVSALIAQINHESANTVRQRLKEWYKEGQAKAKIGNKRVSLAIAPCFPALLKWTLDLLGVTNYVCCSVGCKKPTLVRSPTLGSECVARTNRVG